MHVALQINYWTWLLQKLFFPYTIKIVKYSYEILSHKNAKRTQKEAKPLEYKEVRNHTRWKSRPIITVMSQVSVHGLCQLRP